jgi:hypothetical protein
MGVFQQPARVYPRGGKGMSKDCKGCERKEVAVHNVAHKAAVMAGTTAVGLGVGVTVGVGALAAAAIAEVAIPAILMFKALALTGGALGFLKGAKDAGGPKRLLKDAKDTGSALGLLKGAKNAGEPKGLLKDAKELKS